MNETFVISSADVQRLGQEFLDKLRSLAGPKEPLGVDVITFKAFGGFEYAALKYNARWYVTQDGNNPLSRTGPKTWPELVQHFGLKADSHIEVLRYNDNLPF